MQNISLLCRPHILRKSMGALRFKSKDGARPRPFCSYGSFSNFVLFRRPVPAWLPAFSYGGVDDSIPPPHVAIEGSIHLIFHVDREESKSISPSLDAGVHNAPPRLAPQFFYHSFGRLKTKILMFLLVRMVKISAISPPEIGCIGHGNVDNAYLGPHLISSWMLSFSGHRLAFKKAPALLKVGIRPVSCACAFSHLARVQHGTTAACGFTLDYSGALLKTDSSALAHRIRTFPLFGTQSPYVHAHSCADPWMIVRVYGPFNGPVRDHFDATGASSIVLSDGYLLENLTPLFIYPTQSRDQYPLLCDQIKRAPDISHSWRVIS
ncbi:hypothetical protein B0H14DRAFT_2655359 [Mycena olivaceomarginata]|nr:hypothetical protein B0H14DRAFT_2655359 [Mycena olivaceomarginata]